MTAEPQVNAHPIASVEAIRSHFPALDRRHEGRPVAYFDGPGGTQVPRTVVDAIKDYLLHHNANTHWAYPTSQETDAALAAARRAAADFLGASADEIAFGANMTSLTFHLARALGPLVFVDAVHYAPHALVDTRALGCDFLACSAYKFYGPHVGVLFGRHERIATLDAPKLEPAPEAAPERLETGTQNHEGIVGTAAAVDFLASLAEGPDGPAAGGDRRAALSAVFSALHQRGQKLVTRLWEGRGAIPGLPPPGPP